MRKEYARPSVRGERLADLSGRRHGNALAEVPAPLLPPVNSPPPLHSLGPRCGYNVESARNTTDQQFVIQNARFP
ncbi:hypothetical protein MRX96_006624 [Rhipicephalus microplus]